jgi:DnaJ-class molecular chaperone
MIVSKKRKSPNMDPIKQPTVESGDEMLEDYEPDVMKQELLRVLRWSDVAHYEILELDEKASGDDIKKAYRKKSRLVHPDHNKDVQAKQAFQSKEISE